jgi:hypothetical protein
MFSACSADLDRRGAALSLAHLSEHVNDIGPNVGGVGNFEAIGQDATESLDAPPDALGGGLLVAKLHQGTHDQFLPLFQYIGGQLKWSKDIEFGLLLPDDCPKLSEFDCILVASFTPHLT